jgi:hypothetical protein
VFERKILRGIYGPVCIQGEWRLRTNAELNSSLGHADLVGFINSQRLCWLGHVERMEEKRMLDTEGQDARYKEERTSKEALDR